MFDKRTLQIGIGVSALAAFLLVPALKKEVNAPSLEGDANKKITKPSIPNKVTSPQEANKFVSRKPSSRVNFKSKTLNESSRGTDTKDAPEVLTADTPETLPASGGPRVISSSSDSSSSTSSNDYDYNNSSSESNSNSSSNASTSSDSLSTTITGGGGFFSTDSESDDDSDNNSSSDELEEVELEQEDITCSASVADGSYSYTLKIDISCTSSSSIRYCLSDTGCCDPDSANGQIYDESVVLIGQELDTDYCLSYYGVSSTTNDYSEVFTNSYTINLHLPDLYVSTPTKYIQTTQLLDPMSSISSNDYGLDGYLLGQVNYKSHDITATGDNLNCEEVYSDIGSYSSPSPIETLVATSISSIEPNQQVDIATETSVYVYGKNYLATYLVNTNESPILASCAITEVILEDFDLFLQSSITASSNASGSVSAGFTPYGFYEENLSLPRSPAGQPSYSDGLSSSDSGFLGIIY